MEKGWYLLEELAEGGLEVVGGAEVGVGAEDVPLGWSNYYQHTKQRATAREVVCSEEEEEEGDIAHTPESFSRFIKEYLPN